MHEKVRSSHRFPCCCCAHPNAAVKQVEEIEKRNSRLTATTAVFQVCLQRQEVSSIRGHLSDMRKERSSDNCESLRMFRSATAGSLSRAGNILPLDERTPPQCRGR